MINNHRLAALIKALHGSGFAGPSHEPPRGVASAASSGVH